MAEKDALDSIDEFILANWDKLPERRIAREIHRDRATIAQRVEKLRRRGYTLAAHDPGYWNRKAADERAAALPAVKPTAFEDDRTAATNQHLVVAFQKLQENYKRAQQELAAVDRLIDHIHELAPVSYNPAPPVTVLPPAPKETPESAILLFSDTHVGKVVVPEQTLGFGAYNFDVFLHRLKFLENRVLSILAHHTTVPVKELVVVMLGDMLDGALLHGAEAGQLSPRFNQFFGAGHAIAQFLRNLSAYFPLIRIETCVGNHTRWDSQKRMPTVNRFSNLDQFLYAFVEALTSGIPNIQWNLDEQPFAVFDVQGWTFFAAHGDHWKGGDRAFGIPLHAMARQVNSTTQLFLKHEKPVPDYYLAGHLHREIKIPTALGDMTVNGGFPGLDNYSLDGNFNPVDPMQRFFRVHPKFGKVAEYSIQLKFAELASCSPYELPSKFLCR